MFEDSTFESTGRIRTRSRRWMMATFVLNGTILLALVLIPLIYPEALPRQMMSILLEAPPPPPTPPPVQHVVVRPSHEVPEMQNGQIIAPPRIPTSIRMIDTQEPPVGNNTTSAFADLGGGSEIPGGVFNHSQPPVVHAASGPVRLPSTLVAGLLVYKTIPAYPYIAKAAHREGVVVLQATISTSGTIENLRVVSGDAMFQKAAMDAVSNWRYRPYMLNGQPVEVETTVNVVFRMN